MRLAHRTLLAAAILAFSLQPALADSDSPRKISVTGNAVVKVMPDQVTLSLGVESWGKELGAVKAANQAQLKRVIDAAVQNGVHTRDIQTDYIHIDQDYRDEYASNVRTGKALVGYMVRRSATITLRNVASFEPLLTAAVAAGVTHVHGIQFETTELRRHRDAARAMAIQAAREKAVALAAELGQKVGKPLAINEGHGGWGISYGSWWGSSARGQMAQNVAGNAMGIGAGNSPSDEGALEPGRINVRADVSVTFLLE